MGRSTIKASDLPAIEDDARAHRIRKFASMPKRWPCPQCPKRFPTQFAMIDHERDVHGGPLKPKGER